MAAGPGRGHFLHPEPIETHVFTSLDYRMPLFVKTASGPFEMNGARITRMPDE
jgi:hypothetical protein